MAEKKKPAKKTKPAGKKDEISLKDLEKVTGGAKGNVELTWKVEEGEK